jgi:hypothetical protein
MIAKQFEPDRRRTLSGANSSCGAAYVLAGGRVISREQPAA